jgi:two-component system alkaline phosphatase synthesis response regulator PhoP
VTGSPNVVPKVLLIEDEAPIRLLCRFNLEEAGMAVVEAADGLDGLRKAREEGPDLILLGVMMPGLDGFSVAERLLNDPTTREIPIVFLTTRSEFRDLVWGFELGAVDYITMPFDPVQLGLAIRELIERIDKGEREQLQRENRVRALERH